MHTTAPLDLARPRRRPSTAPQVPALPRLASEPPLPLGENLDGEECWADGMPYAPLMAQLPVSVAIGSSAGGLPALQRFFSAWTPPAGVAVFIVHDVPVEHADLVQELVQLLPEARIAIASDGLQAEPGCVYVAPPGRTVRLDGLLLRLAPRGDAPAAMPINALFDSVALSARRRCVGVLLSGSGEDATDGLERIRRCGGLTFVQDPHTAVCGDLPMRAISSSLADRVLAPERLAAEVAAACGVLLQDLRQDRTAAVPLPAEAGALQLLLWELTRRFHLDFSHYKPEMMSRRIERRMRLLGLNNLQDYLCLLRADAAEIEALYTDILIPVTGFFRDADAFAALREHVLRSWTADRGTTRRIWVTACATGEEAYSIAIELAELFGEHPPPYLIVATDVEPRRIERARAGWFPGSAARGLPPQILERYFVRAGHGIQVRPALRRHVVFSRHDLLSDAPLSGMDLVTCRNVLIYFRPAAQLRVLQGLLSQLDPGSALMLGSSESLPGELQSACEVLDMRARIFRRADDGPPAFRLQSEAQQDGRFAPLLVQPPEAPDAAPAWSAYRRCPGRRQRRGGARGRPPRGQPPAKCRRVRRSADREADDLVVANEELRATNEELLVAHEECAAVLENGERRLTQLDELDIDFGCLLRHGGRAIVFVDAQLRALHASPAAARLLGLDLPVAGKGLDRLARPGFADELAQDLHRAAESGDCVERLVTGEPDSRYLRSVQAYRRADGSQAALVELIRTGDELEAPSLRRVLDSAPCPVALLDAAGVILLVNRAWAEAVDAQGDCGLLCGRPGQFYLDACARPGNASSAIEAARAGIAATLNGRRLRFAARFQQAGSGGLRWVRLSAAALEPADAGCLLWLQDVEDEAGFGTFCDPLPSLTHRP